MAHVLPRPHPVYARSSPSRASRSRAAPHPAASPLLPSSRGSPSRSFHPRGSGSVHPAAIPRAHLAAAPSIREDPQPRIPSSRGSPSRSFHPRGSEGDPWPRRRRAWPLGHSGGRDRPSLRGCGGSVRTAVGRRAGKRPRCAGARRSVAAAPFAWLGDGARASVPGARARGARWRVGTGTADGPRSALWPRPRHAATEPHSHLSNIDFLVIEAPLFLLASGIFFFFLQQQLLSREHC
jgi:hypothetical protein